MSRRLFKCYDQCFGGGSGTVFGQLRPLPSDEVGLKTKLFNAAQARRRLYFYVRKVARLVDVTGAITMTYDGNHIIEGGGNNKSYGGFLMNEVLPEEMRNEVSTHVVKAMNFICAFVWSSMISCYIDPVLFINKEILHILSYKKR